MVVKKDVDTDAVPRKNFTIISFLNNPTGNPGTDTHARKLHLESLTYKVAKLIKDGKKFVVNAVLCDKTRFIYHVKVPSETFEDFHYDVLIEFEGYVKYENNLKHHSVRFFANSPSFTFSAAHVFDFFSILIPETKKKFDAKVFSELPDTRNPDFNTYYEKVLTMAAIYLRDNGYLDDLGSQKAYTTPLFSKFLTTIPSASDKMVEYKKLKDVESAAKKAAKKKTLEDTPKKTKATKKVNLDTDMKVKKGRVLNLDGAKSKVKSTVGMNTNNKVNSKVKNRVNNKIPES